MNQDMRTVTMVVKLPFYAVNKLIEELEEVETLKDPNLSWMVQCDRPDDEEDDDEEDEQDDDWADDDDDDWGDDDDDSL